MSSSTMVSRPLSAPRSRDGKRLFFTSICLLLLIPTSIGSAVFDWSRSQSIEAISALLSAAILVSAWISIRHAAHPRQMIRPHLILLLLLAFYQLATHQAQGYAFLSLFLLPMVCFFLFGHREGLIWSIATGSIAGTLMLLGPGDGSYPIPLTIRFLCSFGITAALALELELIRVVYTRKLTTEQETLKSTLADIRELQGFLPICAACKSIRDDRGFWSSLERYLLQHSRAEITSALCPDCMDDSSAVTLPMITDIGPTPSEIYTEALPSTLSHSKSATSGTFRQRRYLVICLTFTALMGLFFGIPEWIWGQTAAAIVELGTTAVCLALLARLPKTRSFDLIGRAYAVTLFVFTGFQLYSGGASGHAFLWSLPVPPILFALFGRRDGLVWSTLFLVLHLGVFAAPSSFAYAPSSELRVSVILALIILITLGLEVSRQRLRRQLQREKSELQLALDHAETLRGILRLCPRCKAVRDDGGFWRQVEDYLAKHAGTQLSHGLCPTCSRQQLDQLDQLDLVSRQSSSSVVRPG